MAVLCVVYEMRKTLRGVVSISVMAPQFSHRVVKVVQQEKQQTVMICTAMSEIH